jgi:hypothetical protein
MRTCRGANACARTVSRLRLSDCRWRWTGTVKAGPEVGARVVVDIYESHNHCQVANALVMAGAGAEVEDRGTGNMSFFFKTACSRVIIDQSCECRLSICLALLDVSGICFFLSCLIRPVPIGFHVEFRGIKFYTTTSILLIWRGERREFYGIWEEFHHHKTHLVQLSKSQSC